MRFDAKTMSLVRSIVLPAVALLAGAAPIGAPRAVAQAAAATAADQKSVEIIFSPPLDTPLRFQLSRSQTKAGKTAPEIRWIEELVFSRADDGFRMTWQFDRASLPAELRSTSAAKLLAPFTEPLTFEVDNNGTPLRVLDWPAARARMTKTLAAMMPGPERPRNPADAAAGAHAIQAILVQFASLSDTDALPVLLRNIMPALGSGGYSLTLGEPVEQDAEENVALLNLPLKRHVRITLTAIDPGRTATVDYLSTTDGRSMLAMLKSMIDAFAAKGDTARVAALHKQMEQAGDLSVVDETHDVIDLPTGLVLRETNKRMAGSGSSAITEARTLEWIR